MAAIRRRISPFVRVDRARSQALACRPRTKNAERGRPAGDNMGGNQMKSRLVCLAVAAVAIVRRHAHAQQPKSGGILKMYHRETPPSMSIHEEATYSVNVSSMPIYSNLVIYDQHKAQNSVETHRAGARDQLVVERRQQGADLQAARRREVARRQAVHQRGREVHLRHARRHVAEQVPQESAQGLVRQPRSGDARRRLAGRPSS